MPHHTPLIATIAVGLGLAFLLGLAANRLRLPPIVGYLVAGVIDRSVHAGLRRRPEAVPELAEIGVILLMFGVGLHFSLKDLLSVRAIAIPGAIGADRRRRPRWACCWRWRWAGRWVRASSSASRSPWRARSCCCEALQERRLVETERGRIAVGWLIVEDLVMVLTLVLLPPLARLLGGQRRCRASRWACRRAGAGHGVGDARSSPP